MLTRISKQWVTSLDLPTVLMFTLTFISLVFSILTARSSNNSPVLIGNPKEEE
jgi:hypothetical protein